MSLMACGAAVSLTSSSSQTWSITLTDLFQLAKTSSDVRPSAGLLRVLGAIAFRVGDIIPHEYVGSREDACEALLQLVSVGREPGMW